MRLLSVDVSVPRAVQHPSQVVTTGIFKEPVRGPVKLREDGSCCPGGK
jgi:MOSC domain-containing protein YiiM